MKLKFIISKFDISTPSFWHQQLSKILAQSLDLPQVSLAPPNTLRWIYSGPLLCPGWAGPAWLILPPVVTIQQRGRHTSQVFLIRPATTADKICCELWNAVLLKQNNYHYFLAAATTTEDKHPVPITAVLSLLVWRHNALLTLPCTAHC